MDDNEEKQDLTNVNNTTHHSFEEVVIDENELKNKSISVMFELAMDAQKSIDAMSDLFEGPDVFEKIADEYNIISNNQELEYNTENEKEQELNEEEKKREQELDNILSDDIGKEAFVIDKLKNSGVKSEQVAGNLLNSMKNASDYLQNVEIELHKANLELAKDPDDEELKNDVKSLTNRKNNLTEHINKGKEAFFRLLNADEELNNNYLNIIDEYNRKKKESSKYFAGQVSNLRNDTDEGIQATRFDKSIKELSKQYAEDFFKKREKEHSAEEEILAEQKRIDEIKKEKEAFMLDRYKPAELPFKMIPPSLPPDRIKTMTPTIAKVEVPSEELFLKKTTGDFYSFSAAINQTPYVFKSVDEVDAYLDAIVNHKEDFNSYPEATKQTLFYDMLGVKYNAEEYLGALSIYKEQLSKEIGKGTPALSKLYLETMDKIKQYESIRNKADLFLDGIEDDWSETTIKAIGSFGIEFGASVLDLVSSTLILLSKISYVTPLAIPILTSEIIYGKNPIEEGAKVIAKAASDMREYSSENLAIVSENGVAINEIATVSGQVAEQLAETAFVYGKVIKATKLATEGLKGSEWAAKLATGGKASQFIKKTFVDKIDQIVAQSLMTFQGVYRGAMQNATDAEDRAKKYAYESIGQENLYNESMMAYNKVYNDTYAATQDYDYAKKMASEAQDAILNPFLVEHPVFANKLNELRNNVFDAELQTNMVTLIPNLLESFITYRFAKGFLPRQMKITNPVSELPKNITNTMVEVAASTSGEYTEEGLFEHSAIAKAASNGYVETFGGEKITWLQAFQEAANMPETWEEAKIAAWTSLFTSGLQGGISIKQNISNAYRNKKLLDTYYKNFNKTNESLGLSNTVDYLTHAYNFQAVYDMAEKEFKMGNKDKAEILTMVANSMNVEGMINKYGDNAYNLLMKPYQDRLELLKKKGAEENSEEIEAIKIAMNTTDKIFKAKKQVDNLAINYGKEKIFRLEVAKIYNNMKISKMEEEIEYYESIKLANKDDAKKVSKIQKQIDEISSNIVNIKLQSGNAQNTIDFINSREGQLQYIEKNKIYKDIISGVESSDKFLSVNELEKSINDNLRNNKNRINKLNDDIKDELKHSIGSYMLIYGNRIISSNINTEVNAFKNRINTYSSFKKKLYGNTNFVVKEERNGYLLSFDDGASHYIDRSNYRRLKALESRFKSGRIDAVKYGDEKKNIIDDILEAEASIINFNTNRIKNSELRQRDELKYLSSRFTGDKDYSINFKNLKYILGEIELIANEKGISYSEAKEEALHQLIKENKKEAENIEIKNKETENNEQKVEQKSEKTAVKNVEFNVKNEETATENKEPQTTEEEILKGLTLGEGSEKKTEEKTEKKTEENVSNKKVENKSTDKTEVEKIDTSEKTNESTTEIKTEKENTAEKADELITENKKVPKGTTTEKKKKVDPFEEAINKADSEKIKKAINNTKKTLTKKQEDSFLDDFEDLIEGQNVNIDFLPDFNESNKNESIENINNALLRYNFFKKMKKFTDFIYKEYKGNFNIDDIKKKYLARRKKNSLDNFEEAMMLLAYLHTKNDNASIHKSDYTIADSMLKSIAKNTGKSIKQVIDSINTDLSKYSDRAEIGIDTEKYNKTSVDTFVSTLINFFKGKNTSSHKDYYQRPNGIRNIFANSKILSFTRKKMNGSTVSFLGNRIIYDNPELRTLLKNLISLNDESIVKSGDIVSISIEKDELVVKKGDIMLGYFPKADSKTTTYAVRQSDKQSNINKINRYRDKLFEQIKNSEEGKVDVKINIDRTENTIIINDEGIALKDISDLRLFVYDVVNKKHIQIYGNKENVIIDNRDSIIPNLYASGLNTYEIRYKYTDSDGKKHYEAFIPANRSLKSDENSKRTLKSIIQHFLGEDNEVKNHDKETIFNTFTSFANVTSSVSAIKTTESKFSLIVDNDKSDYSIAGNENMPNTLQEGLAFILRKHGMTNVTRTTFNEGKVSFKDIKSIIENSKLPVEKKAMMINEIAEFLSDNMSDKLSNTTTGYDDKIILVNKDGTISSSTKMDYILNNTSTFVAQYMSVSGNPITFLSGGITLNKVKEEKQELPKVEEKKEKELTEIELLYNKLGLTDENKGNYNLLSSKEGLAIKKAISPFVVLTERQRKAIARHIINRAIKNTKTFIYNEFKTEIENSIKEFIKEFVVSSQNDLYKINDTDSIEYHIIEKVLSDLNNEERLSNYIKGIIREEYGIKAEEVTSEGNTELNFDKSSYEEDPLLRSQPAVKIFLANVLNMESKEGIFGLAEGHSIKQVYNLLLSLLSDTDSNLEAVKNRLNMFKDIFEWVTPLINSIDTYPDRDVINNFISTLTLASIDFKTLVVDRKVTTNEDGSTDAIYRASKVDSSSASAYYKLINLFNNNVKSSLYKVNKKLLNTAKVNNIKNEIEELKKDIKGNTTFDEEGLDDAHLKRVKDLFNSIGITLSDATLNYINIYGIKVGSDRITFTKSIGKNGIFESLYYFLNGITNNNNIQSQEILKQITYIESRLSLDYFSTKTIIGDKNVYPYGTKTNLDDVFAILKSSTENPLLSLLENDPYAKDSFLLNILTGKLKGFNSDDITLSHIELNPIKIKEISEEVTDIQHLDSTLRFVVKLLNNAISRKMNTTLSTSNGDEVFFEEKSMLIPTMSDKKRSITINMPTINTVQTGKRASIRFLLEQTVLPELRRMENYKRLLDAGVKNVNVNTIFNFYTFPSLNKYINDVKDSIINNNLKAEDIFKSLSESMVDDVFDDLNALIENKLKYIKHNFKNENTVFALLENTKFKEYKGSKEERLFDFLFNFELNTIFANSQVSRISFMDIMYYYKKDNYNTIGNLTKRMIILSAPGVKPAFESIKNVKFVPLTDIEEIKPENDKYITYLKELIGDEKAELFRMSAGTDGQQYHTWQTHLKILQATGKIGSKKITNKDIDTLYKLFSSGKPIEEMTKEESDLLNLILQVYKPIYTGIRNTNNIAIPTIIKCSSFPLIPQLTSIFPHIDKLRQHLESIEEDDNIVLAAYNSAIKVGNPNKLVKVSEDLTKDKVENAIIELPITGFRLQQNVPYKSALHRRDRIIMGTQIFKILLSSGVLEHLKVNINGKTFTKDEIPKLYNVLISKLFSAKEDLFNRILDVSSINDIIYDEKALKKFVDNVKQGLISSGLDDMFDIIPTDSGFELLFNQLAFPQPIKLQEAIGALNKDLFLSMKMPGYSFVAGSNNGFEKLTTLKTQYGSKVVFTEDIYKRVDKDGKIAFKDNEVMLPHKFRNSNGEMIDLFEKKDGEYLYIEEKKSEAGNTYYVLKDNVDKSLLKVVGYRIPTSAHALGKGYKIIGFTPVEFGDVMLLPRNITTQKGLDFDVDKENVYLKNHRVYDGKIVSAETAALDFIEKLIIGKYIPPRLLGEIDSKPLLDEKLDILYKYFDNYIDKKEYKNAKAKAETNAKLKEEDQIKLSEEEQRVLKIGERMRTIANILFNYRNDIIENEIIDIYKAVYFSKDKNIQRLINYPTTTDHAILQIPLFSDTNNQDMIFLSDEVQDNMFDQNSFGKDAIGIYAKMSVVKYAIESLTEEQRNSIDSALSQILNEIKVIDDRGKISKDVRISNIDGLFNEDKRPIFDALNERVNLATDNGKLQALYRLGITRNNAIFDSTMTMLGFDEVIIDGKRMDFSFLLLNTYSVKNFIEASARQKSIFNKEDYVVDLPSVLLDYFEELGYSEDAFLNRSGIEIDYAKVLKLANIFLAEGINAKILYNDKGEVKNRAVIKERIKALMLLHKIQKYSSILSFISDMIGIHSTNSWSPYEYSTIQNEIFDMLENSESKMNNIKKKIFESIIMEEITQEEADKKRNKTAVIYALNSIWKVKSAFGYYVAKSLEFSNKLFNILNMESFNSVGSYEIRTKEDYLKILNHINSISKNSNGVEIANTLFDNKYSSIEVLEKRLTYQLPFFIRRMKHLISNDENFKKYSDNKFLQLLKIDDNNDIELLSSSYSQEEMLDDMVALIEDKAILSNKGDIILSDNGNRSIGKYTVSDMIKDLITYSALNFNNNYRSVSSIVNAKILNSISNGKYSEVLKRSVKSIEDIADNSSYMAYLALKGIKVFGYIGVRISSKKSFYLYGKNRTVARFNLSKSVIKHRDKWFMRLGDEYSENYIEIFKSDLLRLSTNTFDLTAVRLYVDAMLRLDDSNRLFNLDILRFEKDKKVKDAIKIVRILDTIDEHNKDKVIKFLEYPTSKNNLEGNKGLATINKQGRIIIKLNIEYLNKNIDEALSTYSHEMVHALLRGVLNEDNIEEVSLGEGLLPSYKIRDDADLSPEMRVALNHFIELYNLSKKSLGITTIEQTDNEQYYPLSNIYEFAAGLFENKKFKSLLSQKKYNGESLLNKLSKAVANIIKQLGAYIGISKGTLYSESVDTALRLMIDENNKELLAKLGKYHGEDDEVVSNKSEEYNEENEETEFKELNKENKENNEIKGINISSYESGLGHELSNFANLPIEFRGIKYKSSEEAYQANKPKKQLSEEEFNKQVYDLMVEVLIQKLKTYPNIVHAIDLKGGAKMLANSTHNLIKNGRIVKTDKWTGKDGLFMKALRKAYNTVKSNNELVKSVNEKNTQIKFETSESSNYKDRTIKNASADVTMAIAIDFSTSGEKLTKDAALNQNRAYIPVDANKLEVTEERVKKIVKHLNFIATHRKPNAKGRMEYIYGNEKRDDITSLTTLEAIKNGERTATTIYGSGEYINYWKQLKVGDIIKWEDSNGETVLVRVTRPLHRLDDGTISPEQWSKLEGWSIEHYNRNVKPNLNKAWQIEFELLNENEISLNIAGNGIYTMGNKYTQEQVDNFTYELLKAIINHPDLKVKISSIRTGGQTGFDEAGAKAGIRLGIPTLVYAPKNWKFRNDKGKDIEDEKLFKERFQLKESKINSNVSNNTSKEVKKQFKGKLILAQSGMGKTTASQMSNDVVDVDTLIMNHFNIDPNDKGAKAKMLAKIAETQGFEEEGYNVALRTDFYTSGFVWDAIQYALKNGKTVVIPSWDVIKESIEGNYKHKLIPDYVIIYDDDNKIIERAAKRLDFKPIEQDGEKWIKNNIANFKNTLEAIETVNKEIKLLSGNDKEGNLLFLSDIIFEKDEEQNNTNPIIPTGKLNLNDTYNPNNNQIPKC